ncbi:MAG: VOC family protein [Pseudomonadota bacterium]
MAQQLALVTVVVPDYKAGLSFYRDAVGFEVVEDLPIGPHKRWVVLRPAGGAGAGILLAQAANERQRAAIGNQTGGRVALFLETDDFARDLAAMIAAGVTFLEEPRHESYGIVAVWTDPFGNKWDLLQRSGRGPEEARS